MFDEIPNFKLGVDVVERPYMGEDGSVQNSTPYIVNSKRENNE